MFAQRAASISRVVPLGAVLVLLQACSGPSQTVGANLDQSFQYEDTRELMALVHDATELVRTKGEAAFSEFRVGGSRWRQGEAYIFVLDPQGNMLVHADPEMEGKNEIDLKDINGKPIVRGILGAAMTFPNKPEGWYHYEFPVPGGLLPRWKSSYVRLATTPSGNRYVVGSGTYNDRMEPPFVVDLVNDAVGQIEQQGTAAFPLFHDPTGPYLAKDTYIFVFDRNGIDLVNPGFPNLEGRNLLDLQDTQGKPLVREMFKVVQTRGSGWINYMWPKPGDSVSTQKFAYVSKAKMGDQWVLVGSGVYLADAPKALPVAKKMTALELMTLVREGAAVLEQRGEQAYAEFRQPGSKWFHDDVYFFVWTMDATRVFHAADPGLEGRNERDLKDIQGRPFGKMFLDAGGSPSGEGWVHYMYPEPGNIFPMWKSSFIKRVTFPSGEEHIIGCGIYNMQMDKAFITDVVNRAAALIAERGKEAFGPLRDRTGPFVFMDTYVFVEAPDGTEVVNPGHPSLEGKNLTGVKDIKGKEVVQDEIALAMKEGSGWVDLYRYKPGQNTPTRKQTFVRKVQSGQETYIVGSGVYLEE
ncbi:MAG: cache domain-containing protein [Nitrospira sp.]